MQRVCISHLLPMCQLSGDFCNCDICQHTPPFAVVNVSDDQMVRLHTTDTYISIPKVLLVAPEAFHHTLRAQNCSQIQAAMYVCARTYVPRSR